MKKTLLSLAGLLAFCGAAFAGNGTQDSPYTCAEVIAMNPQSTSDAVHKGVWVEGYIVGNYNNKPFFGADYKTDQSANILISDVENPTDKAQCVCVQLINGTDARAALNLVDNPGNIGKKCGVYGDIMKYNTIPGVKNTSGYSLDGNTQGGGQGGEDPATPTDKILSANFTSGMCDFTIENVSLAEGLSYVWSQTSSYGMKASAYFNSQCNAAEAWLISPVIDLAAATEVGLEFNHCTNNFGDQATAKAQATVWVREEGADWAQLDGVAYPETQGWTFISSGIVSLEKYVGKKIQLGFKYVSTAEVAGTWEIKTLNVYGKGGSVVEPEAEKVADIAAFIAKANANGKTTIEGTTTVVYQNGRYLWVKDASGQILVFGDLATTYTNGQTIPGGITGIYNLRYEVPQMTSPVADTFKAAEGAGTPVEPELISCEDVSIDLANQYVMLKGVTVVEAEAANTYVMTDVTAVDVQLYNQFASATNAVTVTPGENLTVIGFVTAYKETVQIIPVSVRSASGLEAVAAPEFSVPAGEVLAGTEVALTCATEGAAIYYTLDGTEPTTGSTLYTAPIAIAKSCTISAFAVKEGMDNSPVVKATYSVMSIDNPVGNEASFDWRDPAALNPAQEVPFVEEGNANAQSVYIGGITFVNNGVTCVVDDSGVAQASQKARLYKPTNAAGEDLPVELRTYKLTDITFTVVPGYVIKKIEFTGKKATNAQLKADKGTFEESTWTATDDTNSVTFATEATTNIWTVVVTIDVDSSVSSVLNEAAAPVYYDLQGRIVANPTTGLYIIRQGTRTSKVIIR